MRATALLVVICKVHLLLCAVCRQPLPVGQCCPLCNTTDWGSIQWSNSLETLQVHTPVSLGSDVTPLPAAALASQSLRSVFLEGQLSSACLVGPDATCTPGALHWQLNSWGPCSSICEGGHATRKPVCIDTQTGQQLLQGSNLL